jgi:FtsH-binding integral membrane protein
VRTRSHRRSVDLTQEEKMFRTLNFVARSNARLPQFKSSVFKGQFHSKFSFQQRTSTNARRNITTGRASDYMGAVSQGNNTGALITGVVGTAALLGFGYYGLKYLNKPREIITYTATGEPVVYTDTSTSISKGVHDYLYKTFSYVAAGASLTAVSAIAAFRSGIAYRMIGMGPLGSIGLFAGTIATMYITQAVSPSNTVLKHSMFAAFNGLMGLSLCTLGLFAPTAILVKAGLYTLGIIGGLTFIAMNAQEERFLLWGGALSGALLVLIIGSFARILLPAHFVRTGNFLDNLFLYGGLAVFFGLMLYDTQRVMRNARQFEEVKRLAASEQAGYRQLAQIPRPDYISESISIYLNVVNIFIRMVMILARNQQKRR